MMQSSLDIRPGRLRVPVSARDHTLGPTDARVTLVEYADFQCPYAGLAYRAIQQLLRLRGDVRFVFRHFPLVNLYPSGEFAAEAAEVAGAQGRFWLMHDWLFTHQDQVRPVWVTAAAERLGLDTAAFTGRSRRAPIWSGYATTSSAACAAASTARRPSSSTMYATKAATTSTNCWRR